jgi:uncharacterized protein
LFVFVCVVAPGARAQELPERTQPVNDFAKVIDPASRNALDTIIRSLQQASGDVVVVATIDTYAPYADLREYAVKLFENRGRGIGQRGKDNGLLVVLAVMDRQVWVEVGYDLEQFITDGFAGETSRQYMAPEFRRGAYGPGLLVGVSRIIGRIAEGRNATLQRVRSDRPRLVAPTEGSGGTILIGLFVLFILLNVVAARVRGSNRRHYRQRWGGGPWSGWHSGVGPFGGFGGGGGGFGGGFGGFGGGRSGGGGGGAGW